MSHYPPTCVGEVCIKESEQARLLTRYFRAPEDIQAKVHFESLGEDLFLTREISNEELHLPPTSEETTDR